MSPKPTGRFAHREDGLYLLLDRLFTAPIEDVWYSLTNPREMEKWIGTYTGQPATGGVKFRMSSEPDAEWEFVTILECDAPHKFLAEAREGSEQMRVFCHLHEAAGMTTLTLGQRLHSARDAVTMGPGWDYYLDRLIAARAGTPLPAWEHYYPAQSSYYQELVVPARIA